MYICSSAQSEIFFSFGTSRPFLNSRFVTARRRNVYIQYAPLAIRIRSRNNVISFIRVFLLFVLRVLLPLAHAPDCSDHQQSRADDGKRDRSAQRDDTVTGPDAAGGKTRIIPSHLDGEIDQISAAEHIHQLPPVVKVVFSFRLLFRRLLRRVRLFFQLVHIAASHTIIYVIYHTRLRRKKKEKK